MNAQKYFEQHAEELFFLSKINQRNLGIINAPSIIQ